MEGGGHSVYEALLGGGHSYGVEATVARRGTSRLDSMGASKQARDGVWNDPRDTDSTFLPFFERQCHPQNVGPNVLNEALGVRMDLAEGH